LTARDLSIFFVEGLHLNSSSYDICIPHKPKVMAFPLPAHSPNAVKAGTPHGMYLAAEGG
jgi:hypothetical protein